MKKLLVASIAAAALVSGSALAADMPVKARMAPPPAYSWTGCYLGAGGGYGLFSDDHNGEFYPSLTSITPSSTSGGRGWYGTAGGGCDYQFSMGNLGNWIVGAFGDYDFMNIHGNFQGAILPVVGSEKESGAWAVGGRIGYLVTPSVLTFFSAGFTQARFDTINFGGTPFSIGAHNYNGWFLGGGTETSLSPWLPTGWFLKSDYRYSTFQAADLQISAFGAPIPFAEHSNKYVQTIGTELVYRFNFH